ncbi:hypothetical protein [Azorhizobium doebereinerae]|uniref:hypothetical protein n=1 Tax=Azorhizobium doebereinerae TaxID=281091 RepID=UPI0003F6F6E6|nr:hypothetical protein [Azorhizobium doebereinerae]
MAKLTIAQDLIDEARAARCEADAARAERKLQAQMINMQRTSARARAAYELDVERAAKREADRQQMYDDVRAVLEHEAGKETAGALAIRERIKRQARASEQARKAGDPLNLTKHTKGARKPPRVDHNIVLTEVKDPNDSGRVVVAKNFGESIVTRWFRSGMIDADEMAAAEWFRARYEAANIGTIKAQDFGKPVTDGGLPSSTMSDAALMAAADVAGAADAVRAAAGMRAYLVMEDLVGKGAPLKDVAPKWSTLKYKIADGYIIGITKDALEAIAKWRGLVAAPMPKMKKQVDGRGSKVVAPAILVSHDPVAPPIITEIDKFGQVVETKLSRDLRAESERRREQRLKNVPVSSR